MSSSRVALVSDDQRLASSIQTHLKKALGHNVFQCNFDSIRTHIGQETDGLLLLAADRYWNGVVGAGGLVGSRFRSGGRIR